MTRETKIGLLIGLGFIIVFAVLLSHTGLRPPAGDDLPVVIAGRGGEPAGTPAGTFELVNVRPVPSDENSVSPLSLPSRGSGAPPASLQSASVEKLPHPGLLDLHAPGLPAPPTGEGVKLSGGSLPDTGASPVVEIIRRVAPALGEAIEEPEPTPRPGTPDGSPEPEPTRAAPPVKVAAAKKYTIVAGDTLGKIAKKFYDTASGPVVEFLVESNQGQIRNKDFVVAGTEIRIPQLPPELFEQVSGFNLAPISSNARTVGAEDFRRNDHLVKAEGLRRAPEPSKPVAAARKGARNPAAQPDEQFRWYEVQRKDTLSSIAQKQLGSTGLWREIHKLNAHINPTNMQVGTRIKLPKNRPLSEAPASRRARA